LKGEEKKKQVRTQNRGSLGQGGEKREDGEGGKREGTKKICNCGTRGAVSSLTFRLQKKGRGHKRRQALVKNKVVNLPPVREKKRGVPKTARGRVEGEPDKDHGTSQKNSLAQPR